MKKLPVLLIVAIVILSVGVLYETLNSESAKKETQSAQAPYKLRFVLPNGKANQIAGVIATEKGFFKKNNLDVEVVRAEKNSATILISGKADAAVAGPTAYMAAAAQGAQLLWVASLTNNNHSLFLSNKDPQDIKVAGLQNSSMNRTNMVVRLEQIKIDSKKITFLDLGSEDAKLLAFKTKKVDVINVAKVTWLIFAKKNNIPESDYKILIDDNQDENNGLSALVVQAKFLQEHPDAVENLAKSLIEAEYWVQNNRDEAAEIYAKYSEMPKEDALMYIDSFIEDTKDLEFTPSIAKGKAKQALYALENPEIKDYNVENYISLAIAESLKKSGFFEKYNLK